MGLDIEKGLVAVTALPKVDQSVLDSMKIEVPAEPLLDAAAIYTDGGTGPNGTFCLQGWAAKKFGGKLKKDYSMKGKAAAFVVELLDEAAKAFAMEQEGYGGSPHKGWDKGIGYLMAYRLCDHTEVVAQIWNLTMGRLQR